MQNNLSNVELERALLGILLIDPDAYISVADKLRDSHFYDTAHVLIFQAVATAALGGDVNYVAVANILEATNRLEGAGGAVYLTRLVNAVPSVSYLNQYADKVRDLALRRELVDVAQGIALDAHDLTLDVTEVQAAAQGSLLSVAEDTAQAKIVPAAHLAGDLLTRVGQLISGQAQWNVVPTGIKPLDDCLAGGLEPGVYIIAGRASMGKTALMLQIASSIASNSNRIAIFSIEMSNREVGLRLASGIARVSLRTIKAGHTTPEENTRVMDALGQISEWPMHLVDQSTLRPADVLLMSQRIALEHHSLAAVFVDGLWLMTPAQPFSNRVQEVGSISKGIKQTQRQLDVPIVITHQLSRNPEHRTDKRPLLSDLRESGDTEQDADVVLMLYREKYYDLEADDVAEIWIRKNRLGGESNERIDLFWMQQYGRFERLQFDFERRGNDE